MSIVGPFNMFTPTLNSDSALVDTSATYKYLAEGALPYCQYTKPADEHEVRVVNRNTITPISQTSCELSEKLSNGAQYIFIFDQLKTESLLYIGQLCDDDCIALFSKYY